MRPTRAFVRAPWPAAACLLLFGCGGETFEPEEVVPLDQVPPAVIEAAKKALPDVTFDGAWKEKEGDGVAYEVRGTTARGRTRDVKVSPTGEVLEVD
jgi:hypothetical protein